MEPQASATGPEPFRRAFQRRVAERVSGLGDEEAAAWIAGHGLLSMAGVEDLAPGVRRRLRDLRRQTVALNLFAIARFQELVDLLDGIPVCPLKGVFLLDRIYRDDPGCRVLGDVDLLVPETALDEAVTRLVATGTLREPASSRRLRRIYPERVLTGPSLVVDLHGRLGYKHGPVSAWEDVAPVPETVHGRRVYVLDREATLVHLVSHLVKHGPLSRLGWVEDVLLWTEGGVDEAGAVAVARRLGAFRSFVAGVGVLRRLVGRDFLPEVPEASGGLGGRLAALTEERVWAGAAAGRLPEPPERGGDRSGLRALASAVLLADRPGHAARAVAVKAAELALRGSVRRERGSLPSRRAGRATSSLVPAVPFSEEDRRIGAALSGDREALAAALADFRASSGARAGVLLARRAEDAEPPLPLPAEIRALRARTAATWILVERDLRDLGAALGAAGVPWAPIKGADVATRTDPRLYGDPAERAMTDVDLLVPEAAYRPARTALERDGWIDRAPGARFERYVEEEGSAWTGGREGSPLVVELHLRLWGFVPDRLGDDLLERAAPDPGLGPTGRRLRLADAFLLAAVHPWLHLPPRSPANWWELHRMAQAGGPALVDQVAEEAEDSGLVLPVLLSAAQAATLWPDGGCRSLVERLRGTLRWSERSAARRALARPPGEPSIELVAGARLLAGRPSRSGVKPVLRRVWAHPGIVERLTPEGWSWPRRRAVHVLQCLGVLPAPRADWWRAPTHGHRAHRGDRTR